jgi:AraC-like DNA-binding protein
VLLVRYRDETSFSERVRGILRRNLTKVLSLEDVAEKLNVSPQTLRRRLQDDNNCGFQELKDRVRRDVAIHLLQKSRLSLEEIGMSLGFSEVSTFHRAFKRWTGHAPGEYRQIAKT